MRRLAVVGLLCALSVGVGACGDDDDDSTTSSDTTEVTSGAETADEAAADDAAADEADAGMCAPDAMELTTAGKLTIGTDSPAFEPWFVDDDPTNGKGFESAVAYAVAEELGFSADQVEWKVVPFNSSYAPGEKDFDFDINQISITEERAQVVDFSEGYYEAAQAVITVEGSKIASAKTLAELKDAKLGAQVGTTSLEAIQEGIAPTTEPAVFDDTAAAGAALANGQIDGLVADLPTALYLAAAEIDGGVVLGQFEVPGLDNEQFGMLFEKGSTLVECVDAALGQLRSSGDLAAIQKEWLGDAVAPTLG